MTTTPAPAEGRRPGPLARRRAQLSESETGLIPRVAFAAQHGVSDETVRRWVRDLGLPCVYMGNLPFIPVAGAREWAATKGKRR